MHTIRNNTRQGCPLSPLPTNNVLAIIASAVTKEKIKGTENGYQEIKCLYQR